LPKQQRKEGNAMTYELKPLSCDPTKLEGLSEKLIVSHYENNYSGAVKRLNAITAQLESLDFATAPVFVINGLKREELIASNSMILHELYFDASVAKANRTKFCGAHWFAISALRIIGRANSRRWARRLVADQAGYYCNTRIGTKN
jgi:hypothetical protein